MAQLLVLGGRQRRSQRVLPEWEAFEQALVLRVDTTTRQVEVCLEFASPAEACAPEQPSFVFKAGWREGDELFLCTQTEVLIRRGRELSPAGYISHRWFNDLHHVRPTTDGTLLVVNTGLDQILELDRGGAVVREWPALDEDLWARFDRDTDYRRVPTTKPHRAHPNFVLLQGGDIWATRFVQRDCYCLTARRPPLPLEVGSPHDGILFDGRIWFTTVNGFLLETDPAGGVVHRRFDLTELGRRDRPLGWCRGLYPTSDGVWIGFTRLRPTKLQENVSWLKHGFRHAGSFGRLPTRIARFDLRTEAFTDEIDLEAWGCNAIFSILPDFEPTA